MVFVRLFLQSAYKYLLNKEVLSLESHPEIYKDFLQVIRINPFYNKMNIVEISKPCSLLEWVTSLECEKFKKLFRAGNY